MGGSSLVRTFHTVTLVAAVVAGIGGCRMAIDLPYDLDAFVASTQEADTPVSGEQVVTAGPEEAGDTPAGTPAATPVETPIAEAPAPAAAAGITLAWDANPEATVVGYRLYRGMESGLYSEFVDVGNLIEYRVEDLEMGTTYYFAVTAYDTRGVESDYSDEVSYRG